MRASVVVIGIGVVGLVGFGVWLGRSSSSSSPSTPPGIAEPQLATTATSSPSPATTRARVPALPVRTTVARADPGLAADLTAADPKIRRAAVHEVARSSELDAAALLVASRDPDLEVGMVATQALGKLYAEGQVPLQELVARASDRNLNERVRQTALNGFGQIANADAAAVLVDLLARGDVRERRTAAALLANQDPALAVPALIRALGDSDEYVRLQALDALRARSRGRDFGTDAGAWQNWWQSRSRRE
jgi:HEAT repeat protein